MEGKGKLLYHFLTQFLTAAFESQRRLVFALFSTVNEVSPSLRLKNKNSRVE